MSLPEDNHKLEIFSNSLVNFGIGLKNNYKRQRFFLELNFFKNNNLLEKLYSGWRLAKMLSRSEINTSSACSGSLPSLLYYILDINRTDPISQELFFEQILNKKNSLTPIDFIVGSSEKDRLISILKQVYNATITIKKHDNNRCALHTVLAPGKYSGENFYASGFNDNLIEANGPSLNKLFFRFFLDKKVDIIESSLKIIVSGERQYLKSSNIPLDNIKTLSDWSLLKYSQELCLEDETSLLKLLENLLPSTFREALFLTGINQKPAAREFFLPQYIDLTSGKKQSARAFSYHCMGILEDTGGLLIFKEQLCHILHLVGGFNYYEAMEAVEHMALGPDACQEDSNRFINGAIKNGLTLKEARQIISEACGVSGLLTWRNNALETLTPIYQLVYLKNNYPKAFNKAITIYSEQ